MGRFFLSSKAIALLICQKQKKLSRMKVLVVLFALVATTLAFEKCGMKGSGSRIVNGLPAAHGEFPWQISLRFAPFYFYQKQHICGGTLIAPGWVLCAAHCFGSSKNPSKFRVRVGEWHQKDFSGAYAGPAYHGAEGCWLSGWGLIKPPRNMPNTLQKLQGKIWEDADLKARWPNMIYPGMIGFGTNHNSACMGDSGGPLVCPSKSKPGQFDIVGIVSWGRGTCSGAPGVFTEVTHFLPWITANMKLH